MTGGPATIPADVLRFLAAIWRAGDVREMRIPKWDGYKTAGDPPAAIHTQKD